LGIIGIYVASALYVALFMWWFGRYTPVRGLAVGLVIATHAVPHVRSLVPRSAAQGSS
jgi:hypothetical protein